MNTELPKIPSEFIEPYLRKMLSMELEALQFCPTQERLDEAKKNLKGVELFISRFGGIHSRYAVMNIYNSFYALTLKDAILINKLVLDEIYEKND